MTEINQKEYLKKYLGIGKTPGDKKRKKKKKTEKFVLNRVKIIDDDVDANSIVIEEDPTIENEDAPQIVAVIDERPPSLRIDEKTKNHLWQPVGSINDNDNSRGEQKLISSGFKINKKEITQLSNYSQDKKLKRKELGKTTKINQQYDDNSPSRQSGNGDYSPPPRKSKRDISPRDTAISPSRYTRSDDDSSPPRKNRRDDDYSPPRKNRRNNNSPQRKSGKNDDRSPSHKSKKNDDSSPLQKNRRDDDNSPPRKSKKDDDNSPPRKSRKDNDNSPPRKSKKDDANSPIRKNMKDVHSSSPQKSRRDGDNSPPRKNRKAEDGLLGRVRPRKSRWDDDVSPPRTTVRSDESPSSSRSKSRKDDISPPRKNYITSSPIENRSDDISPPRKIKKEDDISPPRRNRRSDDDISPPRKSRKKDDILSKPSSSRQIKPEKDNYRSEKMAKTLDGRVAGLQDARQLAEENKKFRDREEELFRSMSSQVSGQNASTVVRDKSGKIRNFEEEQDKQRKKREEEEKQKEKYSRWGRGLAQVENRQQKIQDELHEMSKPLARYADDEDLERHLKEQEREGDPMLAYIRKKKRKDAAKHGAVEKPQFEGEFMPNRYGIRPGHRWDGVDRSNGYEKRWFEVQNAKTAQLEESYKWSIEDM